MQFITKQQAIIQAMTKKEKTPVAVRVYAVVLVSILMLCVFSSYGQPSFQYRGRIHGSNFGRNSRDSAEKITLFDGDDNRPIKLVMRRINTPMLRTWVGNTSKTRGIQYTDSTGYIIYEFETGQLSIYGDTMQLIKNHFMLLDTVLKQYQMKTQ